MPSHFGRGQVHAVFLETSFVSEPPVQRCTGASGVLILSRTRHLATTASHEHIESGRRHTGDLPTGAYSYRNDSSQANSGIVSCI